MASSIAIRPATADDATSISSLLGQLGYPSSAEDAVVRLARLEAFPDAAAFVAELNGRVVGLVTCHVFPSIHAPALVAWVTTLVVDEHHLHKGAGRRLTCALEQCARERGAVRMTVTTVHHHDGPHTLYTATAYLLT